MHRDVAIAEACAADGIPRLRLYSWSPWALSLGHNQDESQVDRDALDRSGIALVRRPTGGRAVLHAEELTYAVAMPAPGASVHATYAAISHALRRGLEIAGARSIEFARAQPDFREHYGTDDSASCFSASALYELVWHGRKLVGSAQRRYGGVLLQHGSLLIGEAHLGIVDLLHAGLGDERREALKRRLASRTATLETILDGITPEFGRLAECVRDGFAEELAVSMNRADDITRPAHHSNALPVLP